MKEPNMKNKLALHLQLGLGAYQYGVDASGHKYSVREAYIIAHNENVPVEQISVEDAIIIGPGLMMLSTYRKEKIRIQSQGIPIMIGTIGGYNYVLDGMHRITRAHYSKKQTIASYFLNEEQTKRCLTYVTLDDEKI